MQDTFGITKVTNGYLVTYAAPSPQGPVEVAYIAATKDELVKYLDRWWDISNEREEDLSG